MHKSDDLHDDDLLSDEIKAGRQQSRKIESSEQRRKTYSRRRGQPVAYNGIHRRRKRRVNW
jgi:hypothetical protein